MILRVWFWLAAAGFGAGVMAAEPVKFSDALYTKFHHRSNFMICLIVSAINPRVMKNEAPKKKINRASSLSESGYSLSIPAGRDSKQYPSRDTGVGSTALRAPKVYTGTSMLGVATMHKSNSVPVFSSQEATEISSMRR
jgi:hypothetical protein